MFLGAQRHARWRGHCLHSTGQVRLGEALRHELLDLGLGLVGRGGEELGGVFRRQVWRQEADAAQVNPALGERGQDRRTPLRRPDGLDALGSSVLGQPQLADAIGEHRGIRRRQVELTRVELGNVCHHVSGGAAFLRDRS
jgi:hypothetical protein